MIHPFDDDATEDVFNGTNSKAARKIPKDIRVSDQYRITFRFDGEHAHDVRCEDYH